MKVYVIKFVTLGIRGWKPAGTTEQQRQQCCAQEGCQLFDETLSVKYNRIDS